MPDSAISVLQLSDPHIFAAPDARLAEVDTRATFLSTLTAALEEGGEPDLVLLTGDLAAEAEEGAYVWLIETLSTFAAPIWYLPGNHDDPAVMDALARAAGWNPPGSRILGGWHFVLLDSTVAGSEYGRLGPADLESLERSLERHRTLPSVIALHHQPIPVDSRWMDGMGLRNPDEFWRIVDGHPQVRAVVWGHVHQNFDSYRGEVRLLACPSTCVQFAPRANRFALDQRAPGFRRLHLFPNGDVGSAVVRALGAKPPL